MCSPAESKAGNHKKRETGIQKESDALAVGITINNHGRESLVLLSATEYARLKALDTRKAYYAWELPEELAVVLDKAEAPEWTVLFDAELKS